MPHIYIKTSKKAARKISTDESAVLNVGMHTYYIINSYIFTPREIKDRKLSIGFVPKFMSKIIIMDAERVAKAIRDKYSGRASVVIEQD